MDANELRIGNLAHSKITDRDFKIEASDILNIKMGYDYGRVEPIPLTKEWLLKLGFVKNNTWYENGSIGISFSENRMVHIEYSYNQFPIPKYVHKLQNIFYELEGEELTYG